MIFNSTYPISNSPLTGLTRQVSIIAFDWRPTTDLFKLTTYVEYIDNSNVVNQEGLKSYERILEATTETKVNSNGDTLSYPEPGENFETELAAYNAALTKYEYFLELLQSNLTLNQKLTSVIQKADSQGFFN